jgi:hypothetical protein
VTCEWVEINGALVHINHRNKRRYGCSVRGCRQLATSECDWKIGGGKTCDAQLCETHAYEPAPEKDLCPEHAAEWQRRQQRQPTLPGIPPNPSS